MSAETMPKRTRPWWQVDPEISKLWDRLPFRNELRIDRYGRGHIVVVRNRRKRKK